MKKVTKPKVTVKDPKAHYEAVNVLFQRIARRHGKSRGDVVIAYLRDISVFNVRQWLVRPIPKHHWPMLADMAGLSLNQIRQIAE